MFKEFGEFAAVGDFVRPRSSLRRMFAPKTLLSKHIQVTLYKMALIGATVQQEWL
jgi:hypothetical protein